MSDRLPSFEPVPSLPSALRDKVYSDPLALAGDETFTVGQRLAAVVAWRSQVCAWLRAHGEVWSEQHTARRYRLLLVDIDEAIEALLDRLRRIGHDSERDTLETT